MLTTYTTPLANGVTPNRLARILHHHRTMIEVLLPSKTRYAERESKPATPTPSSNPSKHHESSKEGFIPQETSSTTFIYDVVEPSTFGSQTVPVHITNLPNGCDTLVCLPGGARIRAQWRVVQEDLLVEEVEVTAGCWNRRSARKRIENHPSQHKVLMQLAATSKSITGSYATDDSEDEKGMEDDALAYKT